MINWVIYWINWASDYWLVLTIEFFMIITIVQQFITIIPLWDILCPVIQRSLSIHWKRRILKEINTWWQTVWLQSLGYEWISWINRDEMECLWDVLCFMRMFKKDITPDSEPIVLWTNQSRKSLWDNWFQTGRHSEGFW